MRIGEPLKLRPPDHQRTLLEDRYPALCAQIGGIANEILADRAPISRPGEIRSAAKCPEWRAYRRVGGTRPWAPPCGRGPEVEHSRIRGIARPRSACLFRTASDGR